ncbi:MAG: Fpg/Nei family DNA glycosylase, partial [Candidatus Rifleibacteriota bacterium]
MPELPEVNTIVLALDQQLAGDSVVGWNSRCEKLRKKLPDKKQADKIIDKRIRTIFRRAKSIFFEFTEGSYLHIHLGMTGFFVLSERRKKYEKHEHLRLTLKSGRILSFFDPRKFGVVEIIGELPKKVVEPFESSLTIKHFISLCRKSNRAIKNLIMDQKKIAGLGNIYANEALFNAKINPNSSASDLNLTQVRRLYKAMLLVIDKAVKAGQKSLMPDYKINRDTTHFEIETNVYGQKGEIC